jgi:L-aspartate oxidase
MLHFDTIIVGSGLAGLNLALRLANLNQKILIITKKNIAECNSYYAQGGIAAVIAGDDSIDAHVNDTMIAGAYLSNKEVVKDILSKSANTIDWLISQGVKFTLEDNSNLFHLTKEGGHSYRRILHVDDATGEEIVNKLIRKIIDHSNIVVLEHHIAVDLILGSKLGLNDNRCYGIYALDTIKNKVHTFNANQVVLATGGVGKVYLYTTNPDVATGDGIAMAYRAGCEIVDMEFIQFHPTCLYHEKAKSFLISEAVRGEGGILKLPNGYRFMQDHDERLELAPRDVVARAIDYEMKKHGFDCVYLDISYKQSDFIKNHFPNIYAKCLALGIDITKEGIPVVPAAHYSCGGIKTDLNGQTDINGLYAIGECSYTGLHGANRLASNSLLECLVIGDNLCEHIITNHVNDNLNIMLPLWDESQVIDSDEEVIISHNWDEIRRAMWDYVGIVRTNKRLERALHRIELLKKEIDEYYANFKLSLNLLELRNINCVAELIIKSALKRKESRGLHCSKDYPNTSLLIEHSILRRSSL